MEKIINKMDYLIVQGNLRKITLVLFLPVLGGRKAHCFGE